MRRDDELVGREGAERIVDRLQRVAVADLAARVDPGRPHRRERGLEPLGRGSAGAVLVGDPVLQRRVQRRRHDEHLRLPDRGLPLQLGEELAPADRLVGDHEHPPLAGRVRGTGSCLTGSSRASRATSATRRRSHPWRAGTPRDRPSVLITRGDRDQPEVADRQPEETECCLLAPERVPHCCGKVLQNLPARASQDVDRDVDDDPHHVDEVPVDPAHLDPVVVLRD